jgi:hypothetical protein
MDPATTKHRVRHSRSVRSRRKLEDGRTGGVCQWLLGQMRDEAQLTVIGR